MVDILIIPHNIGISHVMKSYLVSKELIGRGYSVKLVYSGPYKDLITDDFRINGILDDYGERDYIESLKRVDENPTQFPFGDTKRLENIVKNEISLIEQFKPSLVVGDTRIPLLISSGAKSVPYISITNANMNPYYKLFDSESEDGAKKIVEIYNCLLTKFGLKKTVNNFYDILVGDFNLITDIPEFMEIKNLPDTMKFVGPILWSYDNIPDWIEEVKTRKESGEKFAFVTMGSTGDSTIFETIFSGLKEKGYNAIATHCKLIDGFNNEEIYSADFTSMDILKYCDLTISHGGSSTLYFSFLHNCPIIGLPINSDQIDNVNSAITLKLGVGLYPKLLEPKHIVDAIDHINNNQEYRKNIQYISNILKDIKGEKVVANIIDEYLKKL